MASLMLWDFDLTASSKVRKTMVNWVRQYSMFALPTLRYGMVYDNLFTCVSLRRAHHGGVVV
jgi:hypothetical protein